MEGRALSRPKFRDDTAVVPPVDLDSRTRRVGENFRFD
jgi:hypothetical protein